MDQVRLERRRQFRIYGPRRQFPAQRLRAVRYARQRLAVGIGFLLADYYANSPVNDPQGPPPARQHVRRGGGWATWSFYCRASFRNYNTPESRYFNLGFRVVMESQ